MTDVPATSAYEVIVAVHVMAVVFAFGVTFAYPIIFAVGARHDPRSLPTLHRVEYTIEYPPEVAIANPSEKSKEPAKPGDIRDFIFKFQSEF